MHACDHMMMGFMGHASNPKSLPSDDISLLDPH